ncbi:MAG: hypothetical protein RL095_4186 [Verrucomicrobiota bacterium]|jgi:hypothetical protein
MKHLLLSLCLTLISACAPHSSPPQTTASEWNRRSYAVHEWGTFTSVSGSDGKLLSGLETEEEALPPFVSQFGAPGLSAGKGLPTLPVAQVTIKMETPVLYFYSPQAQQVEVTVDFRGGLITQWFPHAEASGTPFTTEYDAVNKVRKPFVFSPETSNRLRWPVSIYAPDSFVLPNMASIPGLANHAHLETATWTSPRATSSNMIRSGYIPPPESSDPEQRLLLKSLLEADEKFLFYRGLGHFDIPLKTSADETQVHLENTGSEAIPFALAWEDGQIRWMGRLAAGAKARFAQEDVLKEASLASLVNALIDAGLYRDEALAMLTTWRASYFGSSGLRVFWIVPRRFTDKILPLSIQPAPTQLERVLVGRSEILTPAFERSLLAELALKPEDRRLLRSRYALPYSERIQALKKISP